MKNAILYSVVLMIIGIAGCKSVGGGGDPRTVLISFFEALEKKDIVTARKYATKESESMLNMIETAMKMAPDSIKQKDYNVKNMEFGDPAINGDQATVPVKDKKSGNEATNFILKKEDGNWKVAFDKITMTEMAKTKMKGMKKEHLDALTDSSKKMMQEMSKMADTLKNLINTDSIK